ncbi:MAG: MFS transporter [Desulfobacterales bacterium]|nr:MFS transporter [Desulfobacterales bacterium]
MDKSNKILLLTTACHGVNHMFWEAIGPLMPFLIAAYSLTHTQAGELGLVYILIYGLMNYPSGYLSDKWGKRIFILLFLLISSLSFLMIVFLDIYWQLLLIFALAGFGGGLYHPSGTAILSNTFTAKLRGRSLGLHASGGAMGILFAYLIVSVFSKALGWKFAVICMAGIGFLLLLYFVLFAWRDLEGKDEQFQDAYSEATQEAAPFGFFKVIRSIPHLLLIYAMVMFLFKGAYVWVPTYLKEAYNLEVATAVSLTIILPVMGLFSNYLMGMLSDSVGRRKSLIFVFSMLVVCLVSMYIGFKPILIPLLVVFGFFINSFSGIINAFARDLLPPDVMGMAFGIIFTFSICISSLAPYIMGIISDKFSLSESMLFLAFIAVAGVVITLLIPAKPVEAIS